jgi:hypothetical protein
MALLKRCSIRGPSLSGPLRGREAAPHHAALFEPSSHDTARSTNGEPSAV